MLWRTPQSPLRLKHDLLPRCLSLSTSKLAPRVLTSTSSVRRLHDQQASGGRHAPPLVRHDILLNGLHKPGEHPIDETVKVAGLVRSIRKQKNVAFARVGDGSTLANIQAVFPDPGIAKEYVAHESKSLCSF